MEADAGSFATTLLHYSRPLLISPPQRMTPEATARDGETFDSLENLLAYLSPEFEKQRVGSLMSQLERLAVDREREEREEEAAGEETMA